ncbi:MAG: aminoglycoside phosphotransferase family protein [Actinomycetota bacterium]|nr:aminoglycoside phosphotransferase family protein [Actinomycetota bacterium]
MTSEDIDVNAALVWTESRTGVSVADVRELEGGTTGVMLALRDDRGESTVLRLITKEPWRTHGAALSTRESAVQQMLADGVVPAPQSIALDAGGDVCGHPAHLMTFLPGNTDVERVDAASLAALAELLAAIHGVAPTIEVRTYQSWAWEAKFTVPEWAEHPEVWKEAFDTLRTEPPAFEPVFIHRDFAPRNVLWQDGAVSGVVDWVETSVGPAWLDVAHCCTNIALRHGNAVADSFADAYVSETDREPAAYWDVMDVVGFLPPPSSTGVVTDLAANRRHRRLEQRLLATIDRL